MRKSYTPVYQLGVELSETERQQLEYILEKLEVKRSDFIRLVIGYFYDELKEKEQS